MAQKIGTKEQRLRELRSRNAESTRKTKVVRTPVKITKVRVGRRKG